MPEDLIDLRARPSAAEQPEALAANPFTLVLRGILIAWVLAILGLTAGRVLGEPAHDTVASDAAH